MGLISFALLVAFTLLYLSKSIASKPAFVNTAVDKISANIDKLALYGAAFALVCALLTPVLIYSGLNMLVRLAANLLIILMASPWVYAQLAPKFQDKINPAILEEINNFLGWINRHERYIGFAGAAFAVLMFLIVFA